MSTTCEIIFDHPDGVFYAGQLLRGIVNLTLKKEKKVRGIYVRVHGKAYAHWSERKSFTKRRRQVRRRVSYTGREDYLDETTHFVGGVNANEFNLPIGTHTYTFQCILPAGLPTSVEHRIGYITYSANVVLEIPMRPDKEFKECFTVIKPINLNMDPTYRLPATGQTEKIFYPFGFLCCFPSGPLKAEVNVPVRGYTPGQMINVKIDVNNESKEVLASMEVQLVKEITFHATNVVSSKQKVAEHIIIEEETRGCNPQEKETFYANLRVPSIPPTDFSTSNVVHVKYILRINGTVVGCCSNISPIELPITIGTYPIQDDVAGDSQLSGVISIQPSISNAEAVQTPTAPNLPEAPIAGPSAPPFDEHNLPSYEEAVLASICSNNFKPKYPMYTQETRYSVHMDQ